MIATTVAISSTDPKQVVIGSVLLPLVIGLATLRWWPAARRWIRDTERGARSILALCFAPARRLDAVVRQGTMTALVVITPIWLAVGHPLGGHDEDDRTVVAFATARLAGIGQISAKGEG